MRGLLTDLYELTMAAGYFQAGIADSRATFELSVRQLPSHRSFLIAAGLEQALECFLDFRFEAQELAYLRSLPELARAPEAFFEMLRDFRFTGDVFAVPEGTPVFAGEPLLMARGPLAQVQLAETYLLASISFQTLVASKAARIVAAAQGRGVVEFGTRRAHSPEAGVLAGRAAFIGGCIGTSNTLTGFRYGVPVFGTAAHSWVMAFAGEREAFRELQKLLGPKTVYLIDTYDTLEGARRAAAIGQPLWGVRLDSGDLAVLAHEVRNILDAAGLQNAKIMVSGDLNEYRIRDLLSTGAPIDAFGVGTELATSADAPALGAIYKLVEIESEGITRFPAKFSQDKNTVPGAKQIFRFGDGDVVGLAHETFAGSEPLLQPVIQNGSLVVPLPDCKAARLHAAGALAKIAEQHRRLEDPEPYRVEYSPALQALLEVSGHRNQGSAV